MRSGLPVSLSGQIEFGMDASPVSYYTAASQLQSGVVSGKTLRNPSQDSFSGSAMYKQSSSVRTDSSSSASVSATPRTLSVYVSELMPRVCLICPVSESKYSILSGGSEVDLDTWLDDLESTGVLSIVFETGSLKGSLETRIWAELFRNQYLCFNKSRHNLGNILDCVGALSFWYYLDRKDSMSVFDLSSLNPICLAAALLLFNEGSLVEEVCIKIDFAVSNIVWSPSDKRYLSYVSRLLSPSVASFRPRSIMVKQILIDASFCSEKDLQITLSDSCNSESIDQFVVQYFDAETRSIALTFPRMKQCVLNENIELVLGSRRLPNLRVSYRFNSAFVDNLTSSVLTLPLNQWDLSPDAVIDPAFRVQVITVPAPMSQGTIVLPPYKLGGKKEAFQKAHMVSPNLELIEHFKTNGGFETCDIKISLQVSQNNYLDATMFLYKYFVSTNAGGNEIFLMAKLDSNTKVGLEAGSSKTGDAASSKRGDAASSKKDGDGSSSTSRGSNIVSLAPVKPQAATRGRVVKKFVLSTTPPLTKKGSDISAEMVQEILDAQSADQSPMGAKQTINGSNNMQIGRSFATETDALDISKMQIGKSLAMESAALDISQTQIGKSVAMKSAALDISQTQIGKSLVTETATVDSSQTHITHSINKQMTQIPNSKSSTSQSSTSPVYSTVRPNVEMTLNAACSPMESAVFLPKTTMLLLATPPLPIYVEPLVSTGSALFLLPPNEAALSLVSNGASVALPPAAKGSEPAPLLTSGGDIPALPSTFKGTAPALPPTFKGTAPALPPTFKGTAPALPPTFKGTAPALPPTFKGTAPALPPTFKGTAPALPPTFKGTAPALPVSAVGLPVSPVLRGSAPSSPPKLSFVSGVSGIATVVAAPFAKKAPGLPKAAPPPRDDPVDLPGDLPLGRRLHWKPIRNVSDTIWATMHSGDLSSEFTGLKDVFEDEKKAKVIKSPSPKGSPLADVARVTLLESKRAQNIGVVVARVAVESVAECLLSLTVTSVILPEVLDRLKTVLPTDEEVLCFMSFDESEKSSLRDIEQKIFPLFRIIRLSQRIRFCLVCQQLPPMLLEVEEEIKTLRKSIEEIRNSENLKKLLHLVLLLGNYVNHGSGTGTKTRGFSIESLSKLMEFKSLSDPSITTLHFLAVRLLTTQPQLINMYLDLPSLKSASSKSVESIVQTILTIKRDPEFIRSELGNATGYSDEAITRMRTFLTSIESEIARILSEWNLAEQEMMDIRKFFGEDPRKITMDDFFSHLKSFFDQLNMTCIDLKKRPKKFDKIKLADSL